MPTKYFDTNANYPYHGNRNSFHNISALTIDSESGDAVREIVNRSEAVMSELAVLFNRNYSADFTIITTSGASEGNSSVINHFLYSAISSRRFPVFACPIISHPSVSAKLAEMEKLNLCKVIWIKSDSIGNVSPDDVSSAIGDRKIDCLFIQSVNSETGCIQPVETISKLGYKIAVDDVQGFLKCEFSGRNCDFVTISPHKIGGPIGVGFLLAKERIHAMIGGKQNDGMRGGTINMEGISDSLDAINAFDYSDAIESCKYFKRQIVKKMPFIDFAEFMKMLGRSSFPDKLFVQISTANTLPHIIFGFQMRRNIVVCGGVIKQYLLQRDIIIGTGSACNSGLVTGGVQYGSMLSTDLQDEIKTGFVRLSFCKNKKKDINELVNLLAEIE